MTVAVAMFVALTAAGACLTVGASVFFGYRAGERLAVGIGAISGLVLLLSCGLFAYAVHAPGLSGEDARLAWFGAFIAGVPALCIFMGNLVGYIAMRRLP